jgi:hypothetical protein
MEEKALKKLTILLCLALTSSVLVGGVCAKSNGTLRAVLTQDSDIFTHKEAGIQFVLPKGWKAQPDGEVITVSTADDSLQIVFWVPDNATFDAAVKDLDKELGKTIKKIKTTGQPTQDTHNGMAHYGQSGTGEVEGATIAWSVDVLGAKKPLIILTFAAPTLFEKHIDAYLKLVGSIKKIN